MKKLLLLIIMLILTTGCASQKNDQEKVVNKSDLPDIITLAAYDLGSSGYIQAAAIGDALLKKKNVKVRVIPIGTDLGRIAPLKTGSVQFSLTGVGAYYAWKGIYDFASFEWGPQQLRELWHVVPSGGNALVTAGDANIKTPADLKGKRVTWVPANPTSNVALTAFLAFAGLNWDDVKKVEFTSYNSALRGLVENKVDAAFSTATAPVLYELEASQRGIYWPEFPSSDTEGWARLNKVMPLLYPLKVSTGAGISKEKPREIPAYQYPVLVTYKDTDINLVYSLTKAIYELYDSYKDANPAMEGWEIKKAIRPPGAVPFHEGSIKFFKEQGVWTRELEDWNNKALEKERELLEAWEKAKVNALDKKISSVRFAREWMKLTGEPIVD